MKTKLLITAAAAGALFAGPAIAQGMGQSGADAAKEQASGRTAAAGAAAGQESAGMQSGMPGGRMGQEQVRQIQQALKEKGHDIQADGIMGPNTRDALREFQQAQGLQADGTPTQETLAALGVESEVGMGQGMGSQGMGGQGMGAGGGSMSSPSDSGSSSGPSAPSGQPGTTQDGSSTGTDRGTSPDGRAGR